MGARVKKILVDLTPLLPEGGNGGAKIFILDLLSQMTKLSRETTFILLIKKSCSQELEFLKSDNVYFKTVDNPERQDGKARLKKLFIPNYFISAAKFFLEKSPTILKRLGFKITFLFYQLLRKTQLQASKTLTSNLLFCPFGAPFYHEENIATVCVIYDLQYKSYPDFFSKEEQIQRETIFQEICRKATLISTISNYSRETVLRFSNIHPEKVRTIYLQTPQSIPENNSDFLEFLQRTNLTSGSYLFYPANYWKHKNHEMLITAFQIARATGLNPEIKLVLTGAPQDRYNWIKEIVQKMGLDKQVIFLGYVSKQELAGLIRNSRGLVFPSLYEGFGLPMIEAMVAEVPIACSNVTALPEIVKDAALLFDPRIPSQIATAMMSLSTDEILRQDLIAKGKERAKQFSNQEQMAKEYLELFEEAFHLKQP